MKWMKWVKASLVALVALFVVSLAGAQCTVDVPVGTVCKGPLRSDGPTPTTVHVITPETSKFLCPANATSTAWNVCGRNGELEADYGAGYVSLKGAKGDKGADGSNGTNGLPGVPGTNGKDGTNGINGKDGVGVPGKDGVNGINGANGLNGKDGVGIPGKDGLPGTNGLDGVPGKNGIDGVNGLDGVNGNAATVRVGTVITGTPPAVSNSGTLTDAILNFTLQPGPTGLTGSQGAQGKPGVVVGQIITLTNVTITCPKGRGSVPVGFTSMQCTVSGTVLSVIK